MNIPDIITHLGVAEQSVRLHESKVISSGVTSAINETIKLLRRMLREALEHSDY